MTTHVPKHRAPRGRAARADRAQRHTQPHRAEITTSQRTGGIVPATVLMFRRQRVALVAWSMPLLLMVAITVPAYQSTYPDLVQRAPLVTQMQSTDGMRLLYGILHDPGTLGQLFTWEVGSYVVILTCVMALLLGVSTTRGEEDSGGLELVRASGVQPVAPLVAAMILVFTACFLVGAGSAVILLLQRSSTDELTVAGALGFGAVSTVAGSAVGLVAMLCAQLRGQARGAKSWAFIALGVFFLMRVVADQAIHDDTWPQILTRLNWFTPFGWKEVVSPYTDDNIWALTVFGLVCAALVALVLGLYRAREYAASTVPDRSVSSRAMTVGNVFGWGWVSGRSHLAGWWVAVLLVSALFGSMTAGLVQTLRDSDPTRELLERMSAAPGSGVAADSSQAATALDPTHLLAQFYEFLGLYVAILVAVFGITALTRWRADEKAGHLELELTVGVPRRRTLLARCMVAVCGSLALLAASAALMGWLGEMQMANDVGAGEAFRQSMTSTFGQAPAVVAGIGLTALLIAVLPRATGAIWAIVAGSAFIQAFGGLVDLPQWAQELSLYAWAPVHGEDWPWAQMILLCVMGVLGIAAAASVVGRRDISTG